MHKNSRNLIDYASLIATINASQSSGQELIIVTKHLLITAGMDNRKGAIHHEKNSAYRDHVVKLTRNARRHGNRRFNCEHNY